MKTGAKEVATRDSEKGLPWNTVQGHLERQVHTLSRSSNNLGL